MPVIGYIGKFIAGVIDTATASSMFIQRRKLIRSYGQYLGDLDGELHWQTDADELIEIRREGGCYYVITVMDRQLHKYKQCTIGPRTLRIWVENDEDLLAFRQHVPTLKDIRELATFI